MKFNLLFYIIVFILSSVMNAQEDKRCIFPDISQKEAQKFPWYGNSRFLSSFSDSLYYSNSVNKNKEFVMFKIPVKFWVYRK